MLASMRFPSLRILFAIFFGLIFMMAIERYARYKNQSDAKELIK